MVLFLHEKFDFDIANFPSLDGGIPHITSSRAYSTQLIWFVGKAALLFWFFGDFRCGALLFMVIHVIYKYKNR